MDEKPIQIQIQNADPKNVSIKDAVKETEKNIEYILQMQKYTARMKREQFLALVENGFTDDQAMWLIK